MRSLDQLDISGQKLPELPLKPLAPDMVHAAHQEDRMSFISTGGGSFLEFLEGKELPPFTTLKECGA